jgi:hypothetical protein
MAYTRNRPVGGYLNKGEVGATPVDKTEFANLDAGLDQVANRDVFLLSPLDVGPRRLDHQMVTTFQAGHGWTSAINAGTPTFNLNDTTDYVMGTQAASISAPANAQGYIDKTGLTLDTTGKVLRIWLKIDNLSSIGSVGIYVASDAGSRTSGCSRSSRRTRLRG